MVICRDGAHFVARESESLPTEMMPSACGATCLLKVYFVLKI